MSLTLFLVYMVPVHMHTHDEHLTVSVTLCVETHLFFKHSRYTDAHIRAYIFIFMNSRTQPYLYDQLREIEPVDPQN